MWSNNVNILKVQDDIWNHPQVLAAMRGQYNQQTDVLVGHSLGSQAVLRLCDSLVKESLPLPKRVVLLDPAFIKEQFTGTARKHISNYNRCVSVMQTLAEKGVNLALVKSSLLPETLGLLLHRYDQAMLRSVSDYHQVPCTGNLMGMKRSHDYAVTHFFKEMLPLYVEQITEP